VPEPLRAAFELVRSAGGPRSPGAGSREAGLLVRVLDERGRLSTLDPEAEPGRTLAAAAEAALELAGAEPLGVGGACPGSLR